MSDYYYLNEMTLDYSNKPPKLITPFEVGSFIRIKKDEIGIFGDKDWTTDQKMKVQIDDRGYLFCRNSNGQRADITRKDWKGRIQDLSKYYEYYFDMEFEDTEASLP